MEAIQGRGGSGAIGPAKKQTRTRTGCLNCRRKKRKCDEGRPVCGTCRRRTEHCEWGLKISFRVENAQGIDSAHPSMRRMARTRPSREFEIMDVTSDVIRDYHQPVSWAESDNEADSRIDYREFGLILWEKHTLNRGKEATILKELPIWLEAAQRMETDVLDETLTLFSQRLTLSLHPRSFRPKAPWQTSST